MQIPVGKVFSNQKYKLSNVHHHPSDVAVITITGTKTEACLEMYYNFRLERMHKHSHASLGALMLRDKQATNEVRCIGWNDKSRLEIMF